MTSLPLHHLLRSVGLVALMAAAMGCSNDTTDKGPSQPSTQDKCTTVLNQLAQCYPDLSTQGKCTEETLELYESYNVANLPCATMDDMGKADVFAYGGCDVDEHVCGYIFCCDNYHITVEPQSWEWDIRSVVQTFQSAIPNDVASDRAAKTRSDLLKGVAWTWEQQVVEPAGASPKAMAVELSERVIDVPFAQFVSAMPAQTWGINLAYYLGGEVVVDEEDSQGRAIRQYERMVLNPMPCDMDTRLANNDMTKVELIDYTSDAATVLWRVYYSDNDSTEADVGSVKFSAYDSASTRVTFHSAHRLNAPLSIHISIDIVQMVLKTYFLDHINRYAQIVKK